MGRAPSPADAVGGLSLEDRVVLGGRMVSASGACHNGNPTIVPEGRRWFIYSFRWGAGPVGVVDNIRLAGRVPLWSTWAGGYDNGALVHLDQPIVLHAGERVGAVMFVGDEERVDARTGCSFQVVRAYEL